MTGSSDIIVGRNRCLMGSVDSEYGPARESSMQRPILVVAAFALLGISLGFLGTVSSEAG